ncbi:GNAT family N-acetyltransferase [Flavobacterium gelatinilyticum]|uniref:GNAT family N-acetyltransferase n=1 Tax=Flavobacterium gelatinilyticum TaxID=3003260 RepID=UPI002480B900|nr:GNAT family N-acetyltransferase [Flavobacterium gelatinilyticum]
MDAFLNTIHKVHTNEYKDLLLVWESAVKATHDFLKPEDFIFYKELIPNFFEQVTLHCIKNENLQITGFIGTHEENLEMLFVTADEIGKGIGKKLLLYALENLNITKVDVNKDNLKAAAFYKHFGFEIKSVSDLDGFGKPYPILHLEIKK